MKDDNGREYKVVNKLVHGEYVDVKVYAEVDREESEEYWKFERLVNGDMDAEEYDAVVEEYLGGIWDGH